MGINQKSLLAMAYSPRKSPFNTIGADELIDRVEMLPGVPSSLKSPRDFIYMLSYQLYHSK